MKIEITIEGYDVGFSFADENGKGLRWEDLTREEQMNILKSFTHGYAFFRRFLKDKEECHEE